MRLWGRTMAASISPDIRGSRCAALSRRRARFSWYSASVVNAAAAAPTAAARSSTTTSQPGQGCPSSYRLGGSCKVLCSRPSGSSYHGLVMLVLHKPSLTSGITEWGHPVIAPDGNGPSSTCTA